MGIPEETTSARSLPDGLRDCGTYLNGYTRGDYKCSLLFRTGVCSICAPSATNSSNTIPFLFLFIRFEFTTLAASMLSQLAFRDLYDSGKAVGADVDVEGPAGAESLAGAEDPILLGPAEERVFTILRF